MAGSETGAARSGSTIHVDTAAVSEQVAARWNGESGIHESGIHWADDVEGCELRRVLADHTGPCGVELGGAAWLVTARRAAAGRVAA